VGEGWHRRTGEAHAEVLALRAAGESARGATAYVTLEPCNYHGRTPPCTDALIAGGVTRVVAAMEDPNPQVSGGGLAKLRAAGIDATAGLMAAEARELNIGFVSRMERGRPWLRLKAASSFDGKTALNNGTSQWITGDAARRDGHRWRARTCAILTGIGTVREDDPELTIRAVPCDRQPLRVLVDARLEVSTEAKLLWGGNCLVACAVNAPAKTAALADLGIEVIVLPNTAGKVDLPSLLTELGRRGINEVHVESGFKLNGSLLREGLVDELLLYMAPMLVGHAAQGIFNLAELESLDGATRLVLRDVRMIGPDLRILARPIAR
jgi:diaminohydroxyphosphoribosylaminopyrimidine deaminase/5-amino-6-(5-phosphoribosylamino)uracil reductase